MNHDLLQGDKSIFPDLGILTPGFLGNHIFAFEILNKTLLKRLLFSERMVPAELA